jgi:putative nucleotidyltransferase with HDIG domain
VDFRVRVYVWCVITLAALAVADAVRDVASVFPGPEWLVLAALTIISGTATVRLPNVKAEISISETFVFSAVLIYGPGAGVLTVLLDAAIINLKMASQRKALRFDRALFNLAAPSLAVWLGGNVMVLAGVPPVHNWEGEPIGLQRLMGPLVGFAAVYFLFNSGLVATGIGIAQRASPYKIWYDHFAWLSLNYFSGASISSLLVVVYQTDPGWTFLAVGPVLLILYVTFRESMARVADANHHIGELNQLYLATVQTLAAAIDAKDQVTHGHIKRVQNYARELAVAIGIKNEVQLKAIQAAAVLHDTGKIAIPEAILNKPGPLTADEFEVMKQHAAMGADIISSVNFPYPVEPIVRYHHESWDGSGYPEGLIGTDIPIGARILSVVDCFDALTSDRPYRKQLSDSEAIEILLTRRGKMYDPLVVDTFLKVHRQLSPSSRATGADRGSVSTLPDVGLTLSPEPTPN